MAGVPNKMKKSSTKEQADWEDYKFSSKGKDTIVAKFTNDG
ncbi:hypothetical protein [Aneurinibacillus migulanus]|nr:hypothetical protein [Aneurinibacillus migulanus]MED0896335.1 hypothetical protein [Aneurinibacillus migulanus]GED18083.1 hypothetical protein AMI01nite_60740 [Aneurinibacillus migulanus]